MLGPEAMNPVTDPSQQSSSIGSTNQGVDYTQKKKSRFPRFGRTASSAAKSVGRTASSPSSKA